MGRETAASPPKVPVGGRGQGRVGSPHYRAFLAKLALSLSKGAPVSERRSRLPAPVLSGEPVLGFSSKESTGKGPIGIGVS